MNDHAALLRQHFLFQGAEELLSDALALGAERFSRGETICDPATAERALGIVLEGRAEAVAPTRERAVLAAFGPGDTFGAAALFGGEGYVSRIRAVTGCTVLLLPEALLRQWFARCPRMAVNYIAFLSGRVRFLNGKIAIFTQDSAQHRLYRWLRANCDEWGRLPEKLSMTKLAGALSMGRTSLYRAMEELAEAGLIVRDGKRIEVIL
mgnify:FL=1